MPIPDYVECPYCHNHTAWYVSLTEIYCCICGENYPAPEQRPEPQKEATK